LWPARTVAGLCPLRGVVSLWLNIRAEEPPAGELPDLQPGKTAALHDSRR